MYLLRSLFFFLVFLLSFRLGSQTVNYTIYDTETGLPSSETYAVKQTKNGLLWFTSDRGVFTYNGYNYKTYTTKDGLGNNTCFDIFEREDGSLWFPGYDGTLTKYEKGKFTVHKKISDYVNKTAPHSWIDFCTFAKGRIYFSILNSKKVLVFDEASGSIENLKHSDSMKPGEIIRIGDFEFVSYPRTFQKGNDISLPPLSRIFRVNANSYVYGRGKSIFLLRMVNGKFQRADSVNTGAYIQAKNLLPIDQATGDFLFASEKGLFLYNFAHPGGIKQQILTNINTHSVYRDHEGNFWVATFNRGIIFIPTINFQTCNQSIIGTDKITCVLHADNRIVAGAAAGAVYLIDETKKSEITFNPYFQIPLEQLYLLPDRSVLGFEPIYDKNAPPELADLNVRVQRIARLDKEKIVFSSYNKIYLYQKNNTRGISGNLKIKYVKSLHYAQNRLWIGTISSLCSAAFNGDSLENFVDYGQNFPLLGDRVNDIQAFRNGILLTVFGNGLVFFDGKKPIQLEINKLYKQDFINRIFVVDEKQILLLTNNGLLRVTFSDQNTLRISNVELFDVNDGLSSNFINDASMDNGVLWLATNKGVNYIPMSKMISNTVPPVMNIVGLKTRDSTFNYTSSIVLHPSQNSFTIEFEGISFKKSNRFAFYKYAMIGGRRDTVWYYTNERFIQFTNLDPGNYTFIVSARSKNSNWSQPKALAIFLKPHFTETWWFRILLIALAAFVVYLYIRIRIRNIKLKNEQQKKVELLANKAVETELMALRNQMNPHFVFNSLNSIQRYMITRNFDDANNYITSFSKLMRTSLSMSKLEFIVLEKEIEFIKTYLDLEKMRFENMFDYEILIDPKLDVEMMQIPTLLIQPLLENSIKHGFKNTKQGGKINIKLSYLDETHILVEVSDNGKGIENIQEVLAEKQDGQSFGLGIVMQRLKLLKESNNDEKVTFELINLNPGLKATLIVPIN